MQPTSMQQCNYCAAGFHFLCAALLLDGPVCCCVVEQEIETTPEQTVSTTPELISVPAPELVPEVKPKAKSKAESKPKAAVSMVPLIGPVESPKVRAVKIKHTSDRLVGRPEKQIGEFDDQLSAGRKRASRQFKIASNTTCEWAWRKINGGGVVPVFGCSGRIARHIHHGPDKSVLNNDRQTNISLVCTFCHQLWHVRNDKFYQEPRPADGSTWIPLAPANEKIYTLGDSKPATIDEVIEFELSIDREMSVIDWERIRRVRELTGEIISGTKVRQIEDES